MNLDLQDCRKLDRTYEPLKLSEKEFRHDRANEVQRVKGDCNSQRRLRWRVRNETARLKAEHRLHDLSEHKPYAIEELLLHAFRLTEGIKLRIGLRERFSPLRCTELLHLCSLIIYSGEKALYSPEYSRFQPIFRLIQPPCLIGDLGFSFTLCEEFSEYSLRSPFIQVFQAYIQIQYSSKLQQFVAFL